MTDGLDVEEWRNDLHQHSHCYVAKLQEDTGRPELTEQSWLRDWRTSG